MTTTAIADTSDNPGVIARPPRLFLAFLALGLGLDAAWPLPLLPDVPQVAAGLALTVFGVALMSMAVRQFARARTNVETYRSATALVCDGVYRLSRNPIYLSMGLIYAGIGTLADSVWVIALLLPLLLLLRHGVVAREERYLERKFGPQYLRYQATVRRWL